MSILLFLILGMLVLGLSLPVFIFITGLLPLVLFAAVAMAVVTVFFLIFKYILVALLFVPLFAALVLAVAVGFLPLLFLALPVFMLLVCVLCGGYIFSCTY